VRRAATWHKYETDCKAKSRWELTDLPQLTEELLLVKGVPESSRLCECDQNDSRIGRDVVDSVLSTKVLEEHAALYSRCCMRDGLGTTTTTTAAAAATTSRRAWTTHKALDLHTLQPLIFVESRFVAIPEEPRVIHEAVSLPNNLGDAKGCQCVLSPIDRRLKPGQETRNLKPYTPEGTSLHGMPLARRDLDLEDPRDRLHALDPLGHASWVGRGVGRRRKHARTNTRHMAEH
jgi:hypothetical protein